jgi:hypothetical protein
MVALVTYNYLGKWLMGRPQYVSPQDVMLMFGTALFLAQHVSRVVIKNRRHGRERQKVVLTSKEAQ